VKIKKTDHDKIKKAMEKVGGSINLAQTQRRYTEEGLYGNCFAWDLLRASKIDYNDMYTYMDDPQLCSALKNIIKEIKEENIFWDKKELNGISVSSSK
jgi:hypothetical protein